MLPLPEGGLHRLALADIAETTDAQLAALDPELREIVAGLLLNLAESARWTRLSFRRADDGLLDRVLAIEDLGETQGDGQVYYPEIDDLAILRLSKDVARKVEENLQYPGQIKVTVIRETRAVDYAK